MKVQKNNYVKIVKTVNEVETYLAKLKYALSLDNTIIEFQESRQADFARMIQHTNKYTIAELFPNESAKLVIKEELKKLKTTEYIETVKDTKFPKRSDFWIFGKVYNSKNVYIKFRVEIFERNRIFVLSFHFSEWPFEKKDFPFL